MHFSKENPYFTEDEYHFFSTLFKENKDENTNAISFDNFSDILYANKTINKTTLPASLKSIKTKIEKRHGPGQLFIKEADYYKYIESIKREQESAANEADPEMQQLFDLLAGEQEYIPRTKIQNIIEFFELPINVNEFFKPVEGKTSLNFSEFCSLFRKGCQQDDLLIKTFYSTFVSSGIKDENMDRANSVFPLKCVPHYSKND